MTSEKKVTKLWPGATIHRETIGSSRYGMRRIYRVVIKPGRFAYGKMPTWAWTAAWDSIVQDAEICNGDQKGGS